MVRITSIAIALMATISSVAAASCPAPYDICGWALAGQYGYDVNVLKVAVVAAGQTPTDDNVYGAIYQCREGGGIAWNRPCPGARCNPPQDNALPNYNCAA